MGSITNLEHAMSVLSGIDEETGLDKVHPDNFLTKEQIRAIHTLVGFTKNCCRAYEEPSIVPSLEFPPITLKQALNSVKIGDDIPLDVEEMPICIFKDNEVFYPFRAMKGFDTVVKKCQLYLWI